jgi:two-component system OmpR family sensor kinase
VQRDTEGRLRRFVSDASHELRTPLTSIRGYAELYRRGGDSTEQVGRSMARIEDEASRMARLVDDLLLLARLDESPPLEHVSFDVAAVVTDLVDDVRAVDPARVVSLRAEPAPMVGDRHRVTQAIANVLANARVHTPPGSPIDVTVGGEAGRIEIAVADHGAGLPPTARAQVFDRFYRADPSRARTLGGSGLGLAISSAIVEAHGGQIAVDDTAGGGATFRIQLPALPAPSGAAEADAGGDVPSPTAAD